MARKRAIPRVDPIAELQSHDADCLRCTSYIAGLVEHRRTRSRCPRGAALLRSAVGARLREDDPKKSE